MALRQTRLAATAGRCAALCIVLLWATACDPGQAAPTVGIALSVATPPGSANPFLDSKLAYVTVVTERPGVADTDAQRLTIAYTPGAQLKLAPPDHDITFGKSLQVRIELRGQAAENAGDKPLIGRGRTIPVDIASGDPLLELFPYVTRAQQFAPAVDNDDKVASTEPAAGAAAVVLPNHNALFIGGATPDAGVNEPLLVANYSAFSDAIVEYDTNLRVILHKTARLPTYSGTLSKKRAFHRAATSAAGVVAIAGGYIQASTGPQVTGLVEYLDPVTAMARQSAGAQPHLTHPRAGHQMAHLPIPDSFFIVTGGSGAKLDEKASTTWELWHPKLGVVDLGTLQKARWNHAMVHTTHDGGGHVILVGGENSAGVIADVELLAYDSYGNIATKNSTKVTCAVGSTPYQDGKSNSACAKLKGSDGYREFSWTPVVRPLPGNVGRSRPGATAVVHSTKTWIVIAGGFEDTKTSKPSAAIDIYDPKGDAWVTHSLKLEAARGAPTLATSQGADGRLEVIIMGGVGQDGDTVSTIELLTLPPPGDASLPKLRTATVKAPGGGTVLGAALALPTGHVLVNGGVGVQSGKLAVNQLLRLWSP